MTNFPEKPGRYAPIYQVAEGLTITADARGTWLLVLRRGPERKKRSFGKTEEDLDRALKAAELLAAKLNLPLERPTGDRTFGQVAEAWFNDGVHRWRPGTQERYRSILRDFLKPLHHLHLTQIDRPRVRRLLLDLLKIRSANTVMVVHAVISSIFNEAIDLGYCERNTAYGLLQKILPAKKKRAVREPDPLMAQDRDKLLKSAWEKLPQPLSLVLEVMAMAGLRLGEALAMRAENLDIANRQYLVTETTRHGRSGPPKSGERLVDLDEVLSVKLEAFIKKQRQEALAAGAQGGYLFSGLTQRMVQRAMERACTTARLRRRSPHDLRHTYASILLMAHISPAYVQKQLGHHSISMTVDVYGKWLPGQGREQLDIALRGMITQRSQARVRDTKNP